MDKIINNVELNEKCSAQSKHMMNSVGKMSSRIKEINVQIINAVEFCSNIISRNGLGTSIHIDRFLLYRDIAPTDIKFIINSKKKLMELLCTFPLVFHVVGNEVSLRNWIVFHLNQQTLLQDLLQNSFHRVPIFISTIQFYCNELFKITPMFELPIRQLFSRKSKAPEAIQAVTKNVKEFVLFLKLYPEIFHINCDKVSLSKSALSFKSLETWITHLMVGDFTLTKHINGGETDNSLPGIKSYEILKNEVVVYEVVGFIYKFILYSGSVKGMTLTKLLNKHDKSVPMSTFIKNSVDLELFVTSYPEVFTLNNENVYLTHLYPSITQTEIISAKEEKLNFSRSDEEIKSYEKTIISFYLGLLSNMANLPGKISEFPITHLVYYNAIAPSEVQKTAKNARELKKFLLLYPRIFKINNGNNIVIDEINVLSDTSEKSSTYSIDSSSTDQTIFVKKCKEAVGFYTSLIDKLGGTAKIEQLLDHSWKASKEVQSIATSFDELKNFFCSQRNDFSVVNDSVCLTDMHKNDNFENNTKPNATENAISFYSNVLRNHKSQTLTLIRMSGHRGSAPRDVQNVARNPKELKTFLSHFPEVFTLVDDKVTLSKSSKKNSTNQQQQQDAFPPEKFRNGSEQDTVEFFSKMLSHYGICGVLNINKLFELKLKSSPAVQKISGSNINQFSAFLKKYPQEFLVTNDNVIARKKIPKWSYSGKYENKKFTDPLLMLIFNFFKMYTFNKSIFHIDYLYNNVGRFFLYTDETPVFPSKSDLLLFLGLYPHIFFVDYHRIVNVITSCRKAFVSDIKKKQFRFKSQKIPRSKISKTSKPKVPNSNSPLNVTVTPFNIEIKQLSNEIEENLSSEIETNSKAVKCVATFKPKKGLLNRPRNRRKSKISSTHVSPVVEPSVIEECLASELNDGIEVECNSSNGLELEDYIWCNQYSPCWRNEFLEEFNPPKIEEIENKILSHFIGELNKNYQFPHNKDFKSSHTAKILNLSLPKDLNVMENFDGLVGEVLIFLNNKLWEGGNLKIIKIEELFDSFSKSGLQTNYCCSTLKEFQTFMCKFPDHFIISQKNVMARKNKIQSASCCFNNEEESLPVVIFHFLNLYTKHFNFILLRLLYSQVGKHFCNINRSPFFKSVGDLVLFLEMFPKVFCIHNNQIRNLTSPKGNFHRKFKFNSGVIKIDSFLDKTLYSTIAEEKYTVVPESTEGWKDYVLQRTQVIEDLSQCRVVTTDILNSQKVIALDCEGVNLGAAGILTLVQIGLANGQVYIFDIIKDNAMVNDGGLKDILESESIIKVIHDSRNDVANLYTEYGVESTHIFDTRVAHHLIVTQGVIPKKISSPLTAIGFNELCLKYGANLNVEKDGMKNVYKCNPGYWMKRPLTKDMLAYAALDVASLVPQIFFNMLKQLKGIPEKSLWELSGKHALSVLNNKDLLFNFD